jgi:hypothetical protein
VRERKEERRAEEANRGKVESVDFPKLTGVTIFGKLLSQSRRFSILFAAKPLVPAKPRNRKTASAVDESTNILKY